MFIRKKPMSKGRRVAVQLVRNQRAGTKVRQVIEHHVGNVAADDEAGLQALLQEAKRVREQRLYRKQMPVLPPEDGVLAKLAEPDPEEPPNFGVDAGSCDLEQVAVTGIHQAYGAIYRELGLDRLLPPVRYRASNRALFHTVMARLAKPGSKRDNARTLEKRLSVPMPLERIYRMMDHLDERRIAKLKGMASKLACGWKPDPLDVLFFDCTTLYFESFEEDGLRQRGYSKDGKRFETQVLLALMVTEEGLPVSYELFPGATFEGHSLIPAMRELRKSLTIRRACVVADRGMMSEANLKALEQEGFHFALGAKLRQMSKARQEALLAKDAETPLPDGGKLVELPQEGGRRLVAHWSPKRARKDAWDREQLLDKLGKKLAVNGTARKLLNSRPERVYLRETGNSRLEIDPEKVEAAQRLDGWHGVVTNLPDSDALGVMEQYRGLWQVEAAFRVCKRDLQVRPIFHWTKERIHAHVAIAFMTLTVTRHLQRKLRLRGKTWSTEAIQNVLMETESSVLRDRHSGRRFLYPPSLQPEAREIFLALKLKPPRMPRELT